MWNLNTSPHEVRINLIFYPLRKRVGLDINKFKKEMSGHIYAPQIEESLKSGINSGVEGTPTFFVNGKRYEDSWDLDTFSSILEKTLTTRNR
jgi:protein-disulfide isomerase